MKRFGVFLFVLLLAIPLFAGEVNKPFNLNIFFTNDVHGGIIEQKAEFLNPEFPPELGGGASAAGIIDAVRAKAQKTGGATLLVDAGDIFQGTLVGTLSKGKAVVEYMNKIGYNACTPGNHDFDLGAENLRSLIDASDFPWVSCNIVNKETGQLWEPLKPYTVKIVNGIKIGITGATTVATEYMSFPENIKGLEFLPEIPALQKAVDELRNKEKVDLVFVIVHTGLPYDVKEGYFELQHTTYKDIEKRGYANAMEIAHYVKGIDVLMGGHLHKGYQKPWVDPVNHTICVQNYGNGSNIGWLILKMDKPTKSIADFDFPSADGTLLLLQEDEFWPDTTIANYLLAQQKIYEKGFDEIIGKTETALTRSGVGESPMYNMVTDAMRKRVDADFSFTNFGGIRADLKVGPITKEDIFKVLPFGNQMVEFKISGKMLKQLVENKLRGNGRGMAISGGKIVYNKTLPNGQRITEFLIDGKPLQADKTYRVVTTDYLIEGNSGMEMLTHISKELVAYTGILVREAVIEYVNKYSPLNVKLDGRWEKNDSSKPDPKWEQQFSTPQASVN